MTSQDGRDVRFVDEQGVAALNYAGLAVFDAEGQPLPAGWHARDGALLLRVDDRAARYPLTIDPIAQQAYLKASNTDAQDQLGGSVSVSGDTVVVGAEYESSSATGVNGDGTDNSAIFAGAAYVFVRSGTAWSQQAYLKASNTGAEDEFGWSVSVSGDTVVVGAHLEASSATGVDGDGTDNSAQDAGAAYVFELSDSGVGRPYCFCSSGAPCGNTDGSGGCANSTGAGAVALGSGSTNVSADDLVVTVTGVPAGQNGILFMGASQLQVPFGDGLRCVGGGGVGVFRFPAQNSGPGGQLVLGPGLAAFTAMHLPPQGQIAAGQTWNFQAWFRDPLGPCGNGWNTSNGLSVTFAP